MIGLIDNSIRLIAPVAYSEELTDHIAQQGDIEILPFSEQDLVGLF